ncbi:MAG TPA: hypothetical protein VM491_11150, partial [Burkholderiaceae bacterium]|nr:hypothetical protein [Burkholderiaceae bacterium]
MTSNASFRRRLIAGLVLALAGAAGAQPPHEVSAPLPLRLVIAPLAAPPQCGISQADLDEPMRALARRWPMQSIPAATSVAEPAALHLSVWLNPAKGGGCHYD